MGLLAPPLASSQAMWHSGMSTNKYKFVLLESCVKKCYGCGVNFAEKHRRTPCNLIVKHLDRKVLGKNSLTGQLLYSNDFSNTYYHQEASHIQRKNPVFTGTVYNGNKVCHRVVMRRVMTFVFLENGKKCVIFPYFFKEGQ